MFCCENCFSDIHAKNTVRKIGSIGSCSFCGAKDCFVVDLSKENRLSLAFLSFLNAHDKSSNPEATNFVNSVQKWHILNTDNYHLAKQIIIGLCCSHPSGYNANDSIFDDNAKLIISTDDFNEETDLILSCSWTNFSEIIRYERRFLLTYFNLDCFLWWLSNILCDTLPPDTTLFRGRIADSKVGFPPEKMGIPPLELSKAGRINPQGIRVLYLATTKSTVLHEIRAHCHDYVSIGEFKFKKGTRIKLINLSKIRHISPLSILSNTVDTEEVFFKRLLLNYRNLEEIAHTFSKPLRSTDRDLEYIPTQFLSEAIKIQGYDGIIFESTVDSSGLNIALFKSSLVDCVNVKVVEIRNIEYQYNDVAVPNFLELLHNVIKSWIIKHLVSLFVQKHDS